MTFTIKQADLEQASQASALLAILDAYAREPGGQSAPLSDEARANLVQGVLGQPHATVLMAFDGEKPVGAAVCYWGFSTFAGKPSITIDDLAVLPDFRGRGIGKALLSEVEARARSRGCCKIALEVNDSNEGAKRLYRSFGFEPWESPTLSVSKRL